MLASLGSPCLRRWYARSARRVSRALRRARESLPAALICSLRSGYSRFAWESLPAALVFSLRSEGLSPAALICSLRSGVLACGAGILASLGIVSLPSVARGILAVVAPLLGSLAHLVLDIPQTRPIIHRKHDDDDVDALITQRPYPIKLFLARRIPQAPFDDFPRIGRTRHEFARVFKHGRDVFLCVCPPHQPASPRRRSARTTHLGEASARVHGQETRLAASPIADDDELAGVIWPA